MDKGYNEVDVQNYAHERQRILMYTTGNKKELNILILEILREYTDEDHSLTQQEIIRLLKECYGAECDRRSVKSNILSLKDLGYDISMEKGYRLLSREFDDAELRMLIDSVLFSKSISSRQAKGLIDKLRGFSSKYFDAKVSHVSNLPEIGRTDNKQVMYSLDTINDAISAKKKISFIFNEIGTDFKLHPVSNEPRVATPIQIVANNGRFYLICNYDKYDNVIHVRIDKMTKVKMLEEKARPLKDIKELSEGLNLPRHMAEHVYMFSGPSVNVKLRATRGTMSELVDWFGKDFRILNQDDEYITVRLSCNATAMRFWALQFGPYVEVLEPKSLRNQIREDVEGMAKKYK